MKKNSAAAAAISAAVYRLLSPPLTIASARKADLVLDSTPVVDEASPTDEGVDKDESDEIEDDEEEDEDEDEDEEEDDGGRADVGGADNGDVGTSLNVATSFVPSLLSVFCGLPTARQTLLLTFLLLIVR